MAYNGLTTSNYFRVNSAIAGAVPMTLACWFNSTSASANQNLITIVGGAANWIGLATSGSTAGDPVQFYCQAASAGNVNANTTTGYSTGTWHHACGVAVSATERNAYIDGGSKGTNTTSRSPASMTWTNIGAFYGGGSAFDAVAGVIAEVGIWDVALTEAEVTALAKGVSPRKVRPQSLVAYVPLIRSALDLKGTAWTTVGSPTVTTHPRTYR